jgi:hypothetical protein
MCHVIDKFYSSKEYLCEYGDFTDIDWFDKFGVNK